MIWTPYDWLNMGYSFYKIAVVIMDDGRGLIIEACHRNQPNKCKPLLYKLFCFNTPFKRLYTSNEMEHFSYKGGCDGLMHTHIEVFKRRAGLGCR